MGRRLQISATSCNALFAAAIYDLTQENVTRNVSANITEQIGKLKFMGLKLEATAELAANWASHAGYAYNRTEHVGGTEDGLEMPNVPKLLANLTSG